MAGTFLVTRKIATNLLVEYMPLDSPGDPPAE
jgi:hypothetical protein